MRTDSRLLTIAVTLLVAALLCLLVGASPVQQPIEARRVGPPPKAESETGAQLPADSRSRPGTGRSSAGLRAGAPISLSDPDGQELILEDLTARAAIHGMLSLTELEFRFRNPQPRRIEGRFTCTLPADAAISRFAKEVNGQLMEGEVVERLRANQVYEQFLHQMRDPALLEQDQGNRFSARIFPIEANASVRILLSYTALLPLRDGVRTYTLPLRGVATIGHFNFRGFVTALPGEQSVQEERGLAAPALSRSAADVYAQEERDYTPATDITLSWGPSADAPRSRVLRAGDFYLASFRPEGTAGKQPATARSWAFYVDTSASSAEGAEHRIRAIESILGALPAGDDVQVEAFDHDVARLGSGTASEMARSIGALLRARLFLGGTDLTAAMRHAARDAQQQRDRVIVFASDLVPTLGATDPSDLTQAAAAFPPSVRVHALILGSRENLPAALSLTAGRGRVVRLPFTESLETDARAAAAALRRPLGASFTAADSSAEWFYPRRVDDVQSGDEIIVLGKVRAGSEPAITLSGGENVDRRSVSASTFGPLLERESYRAYLAYLVEREANEPSPAVRRALAAEQVNISVEQRVVIPRTTMLVLESEWDYQRFGIDRRALAAILTIDAGGISRIDRAGSEPRPLPGPMPPSRRPVEPMLQKSAAAATSIGGSAADAVSTREIAAEGGVEQVVANGATGGVAFSEDRENVRVEAAAVTRVTASAPPISPAPADRRDRPRIQPPPEKRASADWTRRRIPEREEVERLRSRLAENPRDREAYNQLAEVFAARAEWSELRKLALAWQPYDPENPQVYEMLGLADEGLDKRAEAARAYASLIEVAPAKTELLQRAGLLLVRIGRASIAESPLRRSLELRPDRVNSYRHLALMLWLDGRPEDAARILEAATRQTFPAWYGNANRVVREELGYVYRSWMAKAPERRNEIIDRAREYGADLSRRDALRVSLAWETDANDVDLHVVDPDGDECFYGHRENRSGLALYEDITQGLGPEVIRTDHLDRGTYHVGVRYFAAGPMGVSRGIVVIVRDRGALEPSVEVEPFRLVQGGGEIRYVTRVDAE